jgi:Arc/MetJ-type ribon-helix-helix transcriptional regulator
MSAMTVSLSDDAREFVEAEATAGGFASAGAFIAKLVHDEQKRIARNKIDQMLLKALEGPATEVTKADWENLRREVKERLEQEATHEPHRSAGRGPSRAGGNR